MLHSVAIANLAYVGAWCLPLLAAGSLLRTARYRALLPHFGKGYGLWDVWSAVVLSAAANNVLPLRAGELIRTRETMAAGATLLEVAFAQVAEKVVEAATLIVWATPVLASYVAHGRLTVAVAALIAVIALVTTWALRFDRLHTLQGIALSSVWSLAADAIEIAIVAVCLRGVGLPGGLAASVAVFAAVNLAIALPSTPGNVGAFEAGAALPLIAMGVGRDAAIAFAFVYRAVQWLPVSIVGCILWARRVRPVPANAPSR
jgi:hypothetical protein